MIALRGSDTRARLSVAADLGTLWATMRGHHDHGSARVPGHHPTWNDDAHCGENFVASEQVAAVQCQQFRHLDELLAGLERMYAIAMAEPPGRPGLEALPRAAGDVKVSLRFRCESKEVRDAVVAGLTAAGIANWTLGKYLPPEHPVLTGRRSLLLTRPRAVRAGGTARTTASIPASSPHRPQGSPPGSEIRAGRRTTPRRFSLTARQRRRAAAWRG
ncbi:hypothetical protein ACFRI7_22635 [Streptomyces sp. NPDC056716]|uniref:hypothetical protein n=1 Tax=unclassified Streptomyces TaxID=2593676 RepID=UPI0036980EB1